jgi:hypothetical protein
VLDLASRAQANKVKDRLPQIDADCVDFHGPPPLLTSYTPEGLEAADHTFCIADNTPGTYKTEASRSFLPTYSAPCMIGATQSSLHWTSCPATLSEWARSGRSQEPKVHRETEGL